jgi:predicted O-linked N-acetylglucosamine transferase (SPINDLY family)
MNDSDRAAGEALRLYREGRLDHAASRCLGVLDKAPGHPGALQVLAAVRLAERRFEDAIGLARRAVAVMPRVAEPHNNLGAMLMRLGRDAEALAAFDKALALKPDFAEAHNNRGHALTALARPEEALKSLDRALKLRPGYAAALFNRGDALRALGRREEAVESYGRAAAADPRNAGALINLGCVLAELGRREEALGSFDRALAAEPNRAEAHFNRGNALAALGRHEEAIASFDRAIEANPAYVEATLNRGNALVALKRTEEALESYDRALAAQPEHVEALINRANASLELRRWDEALAVFDRALQARPGAAAAHSGRGNALYALNRMAEAAAAFKRAAEIDPGDSAALSGLGVALADQGLRAQALDCYRRAIALDPANAEARWRLCLHTIPILPEAGEDVAASRRDFARELDELGGWLAAHPPGERELVGNVQPFYLAYQEAENRELLSRYGALCADLMRDWRGRQGLQAAAPRPPGGGGPIRVGVVSAHFLDHSVWNAVVKGWFEHFNRGRVALHAFHLGPRTDFETVLAQERAEGFTQGLKTPRQWVDAIAAAAPDVLIYPEIGMDPMAVKLASQRLAPVQATCWGHPETSGLPTIDYYISADGMEPPGAEAYYSEKLVRLPRLGCCYARLAAEGRAPDLAALRVAADVPLLLCAGMPFKYAPERDGALVEIAKRLKRCQFVFFVDGKRRELSDRLKERLAAAFARAGLDFGAFAVFVPWQSRAEFHGLMKRADVFLDTIGFSGFNTAVQAVECGLPIVAWEGKFLRGRFASAILRRIGLGELATDSEAAYVELAARLAADAAYNRATRARIEAGRGVLFDDVETVKALEEFLVGAAGRP